jgi:hypothetical protein
MWRGGVGLVQKHQPLGRKPKVTGRPPRLLLTNRTKPLGRVGARIRMRPGAIGQSRHQGIAARRDARRDQPATAQALVVGVRRQDQACPAANDVVRSTERQPPPRTVKISGRGHTRAPG